MSPPHTHTHTDVEWELHESRSPLTLFTVSLQHPVHEKCSRISRECMGHTWCWRLPLQGPLVIYDFNVGDEKRQKSGRGTGRWFQWEKGECILFNQEKNHRSAQDLAWAFSEQGDGKMRSRSFWILVTCPCDCSTCVLSPSLWCHVPMVCKGWEFTASQRNSSRDIWLCGV